MKTVITKTYKAVWLVYKHALVIPSPPLYSISEEPVTGCCLLALCFTGLIIHGVLLDSNISVLLVPVRTRR